jgi:carbon monoxide dehydrogenase subunit G
LISITEQIAVPSPRDRVWAVISDPAQVVSCINGAEVGQAHEDGSFDATLTVKFAAVRVRFAARVSLELSPEEFDGRLNARGRDGQGATRFSASATFWVREAATPGQSLVDLAGQIELTGKLAGLVEAGANAVVARMARDFTTRLIARCTEPVEPAPAESPEPVEPAPAESAESAERLNDRPTARRRWERVLAWWSDRIRHPFSRLKDSKDAGKPRDLNEEGKRVQAG